MVPVQTVHTVPDRTEFRKLARTFSLIPVYCEVVADADTPVTAMQKLGEGSCTWLLESVEAGERLSRYSFLGNSAYQLFTAHGHRVSTVNEDGQEYAWTSPNPLSDLEDLIGQHRPAPVPGLPKFYGGAVGYLSYDAARYFIPISEHSMNFQHLPDLCFLLTNTVLVFDHVKQSLQIVVNTRVGTDPDQAYRNAVDTLKATLQRLRRTPGQVGEYMTLDHSEPLHPLAFTSTFTRTDFLAAVHRCQKHIRAGEVDQVVLSQRLSAPLSASPFQVYRRLRALNPSPYMFYLKLPGIQLAGSSPETLVSVKDGVVTVCPIAGTRRRGHTASEDAAVATELLADAKEQREHVMLAEMGRRDLTKVCPGGTIRVADSMKIERYSHVMHLVTRMTGTLADGKTPFDALRATFPAGTVSGAPRKHAMQIINALEPVGRGPYAGGVGYFGFGGNMDICIAIRCVVMVDGVAHVQAGAGIVAESDPAKEYEETLAKAQAALVAIQPDGESSVTLGGVASA